MDSSGNVMAEYVWGLEGPLMLRRRDNSSSPWYERYYVQDGFGHTRLLLDNQGNVTDDYVYDAWGNVIGGIAGAQNPFGWNGAYGYEYLPQIQLYHVGAREYDPHTGRWLQKDPINLGGGSPNLYQYCFNDPINFVDPTGLDWLDNMANFWAGVGDSLTFGVTDLIREGIGANEVVDKTSIAYRAGEYTEVAVEVAVSGGSKVLLKKALNKATANKAAREVIRQESETFVRPLRQPNMFVHHKNPVLGHPDGSRTLFPTGGLSPNVHSGKWNLEVVNRAPHTQRHNRLKRQEKLAKMIWNRWTISGRFLNNLWRDWRNSDEGCDEAMPGPVAAPVTRVID